MKNEFVPYDIALAMKELGFKKKCFKFYWADEVLYAGVGEFKNKETDLSDEKVSAPLYQQAFRWFREKYNLTFNYLPLAENGHSYKVYEENKPICNQIITDSYEEAQDACLRKLIQIVKELRRN